MPRSYPSSANRGRRSATRIDKNGSEWISSTSIQPSSRASVEERKTTWCVEGDNLTRSEVMSPSPGLAPRWAVTHQALHRPIRPQRGRQTMAAAGQAIILPKQAIPCGLPTCAFLSECKRASCPKPASDCLRTPHCAKKHASLSLLRCWPKSCTGSPRQKVGRQQQDGSCAWSSICQSTMRLRTRGRLSAPRWEKKTLLLATRHAAGNLFSEDGRRIFICAAILRWRAMCVGFGDRQPCLGRSRHWSDGVARCSA